MATTEQHPRLGQARDHLPLLPPVAATDTVDTAVLKHENVYLVSDPEGDIGEGNTSGLGLYRGDTRYLSRFELRVNRQRPVLLAAGSPAAYRGTIQLTNPTLLLDPEEKRRPEPVLDKQSLGIRRSRLIEGGLIERIGFVNYTQHEVEVEVELTIDADFADIFEVRGWRRERRGEFRQLRFEADRALFGYTGLDGTERRTAVRFDPPPDRFDGVSAAWSWRLDQQGERSVVVAVRPVIGAEPLDAAFAAPGIVPGTVRNGDADGHGTPSVLDSRAAAAYRAWQESTASFETSNDLFNQLIGRSRLDLCALLNIDRASGLRYPAAGIPWFSALFGRDSILTALEALPLTQQLAVDTLDLLARYQADEDAPEHDAEPGKMPHEFRFGEMANCGETPMSRYYGSADSTPLWLVLLSETYRWTGDLALVERLWPNVERAIEWIDRHGDADGDGFVEYRRRNPRGLENQGWKDSWNSVLHADGSLAAPPIALVEIQGYVYDARVRVADLAARLGRHEFAEEQRAAAASLRSRFDEAFWDPAAGAYAMALDADKRRVTSLANNAGHCLWSGIVPEQKARAVADALLEPTLFSGWGIRTLSRNQPGFNPIGYHVGSVWPHDNAIIAAGLARYDLHAESMTVASRILESGYRFRDMRLPELFCGFDRHRTDLPVPYPVACVPQAWSAAAPFLLLRTMLGLEANAHRGRLDLIRPMLPDWLSELVVRDLRVGEASIDLRVRREDGVAGVEVLGRRGPLDVQVRL